MSDTQAQDSATDPAATEPATGQQPAAPESTEPQKEGSLSPEKLADGDGGVDWKAKAREWEKRAKANKSAADRLAEIEEAQKTEEQRRQEQLDEAMSIATSSRQELWRERAARKHGLDDELMQFVGGETEEEVLARAETLATKLAAKREADSQPDRRPDPSQGAGSGTGGQPSLQEQIRQAEQSGDIATSLALKNKLLTDQQK